MKLSGEYRLATKPDAIKRYFENPDLFKRCLPGCSAIETLHPGNYLATVTRINGTMEETQYLFKYTPGEDKNAFTMTWRGTDASNLMSHGEHQIRLLQNGKTTILAHHSSVELTKRGKECAIDPGKIMTPLTHLFENIVDQLKNDPDKTDVKDEGLLAKAEDAVVEMEHEAEEAAATGFLGGAQMWGWIAFGILILVLIFVFE